MKAKENSTELWTTPEIKIISVDETMSGSGTKNMDAFNSYEES
jgi:hypothetical protein